MKTRLPPKEVVVGLKIYDPRSNSWIASDNPALIMADLLCRGFIKTSLRLDKALDNKFWDRIEEMANTCDREGYR